MIISLDTIVRDYNLKIRGVLHIGAHHGQEYADYVKHGIENMIFFEPVKSNFQELVKRLPIGIRCINMALGNESGWMDMYIETANQGQSCSLLEPGTHLKSYPHIQFPTKEAVAVERLDNISFDHSLYNMINIDVQGFELEVFKGAEETLESINIIYTEVNFEKVYKDCALVEDLDRYLSPYGFKRVLTDGRYGTWGDALYLKK